MFEYDIEHPYRYVQALAKSVVSDEQLRGVAQIAWQLVVDSLRGTLLCLQFSARLVAAAAVQMAVSLSLATADNGAVQSFVNAAWARQWELEPADVQSAIEQIVDVWDDAQIASLCERYPLHAAILRQRGTGSFARLLDADLSPDERARIAALAAQDAARLKKLAIVPPPPPPVVEAPPPPVQQRIPVLSQLTRASAYDPSAASHEAPRYRHGAPPPPQPSSASSSSSAAAPYHQQAPPPHHAAAASVTSSVFYSSYSSSSSASATTATTAAHARPPLSSSASSISAPPPSSSSHLPPAHYSYRAVQGSAYVGYEAPPPPADRRRDTGYEAPPISDRRRDAGYDAVPQPDAARRRHWEVAPPPPPSLSSPAPRPLPPAHRYDSGRTAPPPLSSAVAAPPPPSSSLSSPAPRLLPPAHRYDSGRTAPPPLSSMSSSSSSAPVPASARSLPMPHQRHDQARAQLPPLPSAASYSSNNRGFSMQPQPPSMDERDNARKRQAPPPQRAHNNLVCHHCGERGHARPSCIKLHGPNAASNGGGPKAKRGR
jgi:hypothetical protein